MTHPTPGHPARTPFGKRGRHWQTDQAGDPLRRLRRGKNGRPGWGIHTGTDFPAPTGTPILSCTPGKVIAANQWDGSYGWIVVIRWDGKDVRYNHMPEGAATVRVGQTVRAGQRIGAVGSTGNSTGSHLHLEVRPAGAGWGPGNFIDPAIAIAIDYQERPVFKFTFLHKPHKPITLGPAWTDLTFTAKGKERRWFYSDRDGFLVIKCYVPLAVKVATLSRLARVEWRVVRDKHDGQPVDPTAMDSRTLIPDAEGDCPSTFHYIGQAEKGRRYKVQARIVGKATATTTGTQYAQAWML